MFVELELELAALPDPEPDAPPPAAPVSAGDVVLLVEVLEASLDGVALDELVAVFVASVELVVLDAAAWSFSRTLMTPLLTEPEVLAVADELVGAVEAVMLGVVALWSAAGLDTLSAAAFWLDRLATLMLVATFPTTPDTDISTSPGFTECARSLRFDR